MPFPLASPSMGATRRRVVQMYQDYFPKRGGIEDHIRMLSSLLPRHLEIIVLTSSNRVYTSWEWVEDVSVLRVASYGKYYTPVCPMMSVYLRQMGADLIHIHMPCPVAELAFLLAHPDAALIVSYHNDIIKPRFLLELYRPFLRKILERARYIFVGSDAYRDSSPELRDFKHKCVVIPYGVCIESFHPTDALLAHAAQIRSVYPRRLVLFVGRLCYYKGLEYLIPAMQRVDAELLIIGTGPLERQLRSLAASVGTHIHFIGPVSDNDLAAYYHASEIVVLPSTMRSESFGLVQIQAQACARPVITTGLPGVSSVTLHGQTGLIVPPGSPVHLRESISTLLENNPLRKAMGSAGFARVTEHYQASQMVRRICEIYESLC